MARARPPAAAPTTDAGGPLGEAEWQAHRALARQSLPEALVGRALPDVLLPYQRELLATVSAHALTVAEKSRRIGATWGIGALAVLTAGARKSAGGMDVLYIGYNLDMAREFIDTCAMWARAFAPACTAVGEYLFSDGPDREIKAYRILFSSGYEIVALSSRPRSLRGRQGFVIIDEAAFHDDFAELLKAALALLIWGGRVLVISTHNGIDNPYAELMAEIRSGRRPGAVVRCTFDDALEQGLSRRICLTTGRPWSAAAEAAWRTEIRGYYGDGAAEELDCVARDGGGKYLARTLIEARMVPAPVVRWACADDFGRAPDRVREAECAAWIADTLDPLLAPLDRRARSAIGEDFGRSGDLTVIWPLLVDQGLRRRTPFVIELRNVPFRQQEQILLHVGNRLPRLIYAALDGRGNGQYLAERAVQSWGALRAEAVMLSRPWYLEHMPRLKAGLEDDLLEVPRDADVMADLRAIEMVRGVPMIPDGATASTGGQRHGDAAVAAMLAWYASEQDGGEYAYTPAPASGDGGRAGDRDGRGEPRRCRFGRGGW